MGRFWGWRLSLGVEGGADGAEQARGWWGSAACAWSLGMQNRSRALPSDDCGTRVQAAGVPSPAGPWNPHRAHTKSREGVFGRQGPHHSPAQQGQDTRESLDGMGAQQGLRTGPRIAAQINHPGAGPGDTSEVQTETPRQGRAWKAMSGPPAGPPGQPGGKDAGGPRGEPFGIQVHLRGTCGTHL